MFRAFSIQGEYNIEEMNDEWYIDKDYNNLALLEGKKIGVLYWRWNININDLFHYVDVIKSSAARFIGK